MADKKNSAVSIAGYSDFEVIGDGSTGTVYRAKSKVGRSVAVKVIEVEPFDRKAFLAECETMAKVAGHPNIVGIIESGVTDVHQSFLSMDLYEKSLDDRLNLGGKLTDKQTIGIGRRLVSALQFAHQSDVVHGDVKPGNILLSEFGEPALADFGIATLASNATNRRGYTLPYAAPELLTGSSNDFATDVYALGATLYRALAGSLPFAIDDLGDPHTDEVARKLHARILESKQPPTIAGAPPPLVHALRDMMAINPGKRPKAKDLVEVFEGLSTAYGVAPLAKPAAPETTVHTVAPVTREAQLPAAGTDQPAGTDKPNDEVVAPADPEEEPSPNSSRTPWLAGGVLALLGLVVGGVMLFSNGDDESPGDTAPGSTAAATTAAPTSAPAPATTVAPPTTTSTSTTTTTTTSTTTTTVALAPGVELTALVAGADVAGAGCTYNDGYIDGLVEIAEPMFDGTTVTLGGANRGAQHAEVRVRTAGDRPLYWHDGQWIKTAESNYVPLEEVWSLSVDLPDGDYCAVAWGRDRTNGGTNKGETIAFRIAGSEAAAIVESESIANTASLIAGPGNGSAFYTDQGIRIRLKEGIETFEIRQDGERIAIDPTQLEQLLGGDAVSFYLEPGAYEFEARRAGTFDVHKALVVPAI